MIDKNVIEGSLDLIATAFVQLPVYPFIDSTWRAEARRRSLAVGGDGYNASRDGDSARMRDSSVFICSPSSAR